MLAMKKGGEVENVFEIVGVRSSIVFDHPLILSVTVRSPLQLETNACDVRHNLFVVRADDVVVTCCTRTLPKRPGAQLNTAVYSPRNIQCVACVVHSLDLVVVIQLNLSGLTYIAKKTFQFFFIFGEILKKKYK